MPVTFTGSQYAEVGSFWKRLRKGLKKGFKGFVELHEKIIGPITKRLAKMLPPPYNVVFSIATKIHDATMGRLEHEIAFGKRKKAIAGLARMAKRGDRKALATLKAIHLVHLASNGQPEHALRAIARHNAAHGTAALQRKQKAAATRVLAHPRIAALPREARVAAAKRAAKNALAYQVKTPAGRTFIVRL